MGHSIKLPTAWFPEMVGHLKDNKKPTMSLYCGIRWWTVRFCTYYVNYLHRVKSQHSIIIWHWHPTYLSQILPMSRVQILQVATGDMWCLCSVPSRTCTVSGPKKFKDSPTSQAVLKSWFHTGTGSPSFSLTCINWVLYPRGSRTAILSVENYKLSNLYGKLHVDRGV